MTVGLVIVSHSASLATGVVELAGQMAPDVTLVAAGGGEDGSLGTDFDKISSALGTADSGDGVVVLYDLGSALLTTETALEFLDPDEAARILVVDAPLVEGALAAAVAAQAGDSREAVAAAARGAVSTSSTNEGEVSTSSTNDETSSTNDTTPAELSADVLLVNPLGLHARPAAQLSAEAARWDAVIRIGRLNDKPVGIKSVLAVVGMALRGGETVRLSATGPLADQALQAITTLITDGFGEKGHTETPQQASTKTQNDVLYANPGSPGLAIGAAHRLDELEPTFSTKDPSGTAEQEANKLDSAITRAAQRLSNGTAFDQAHAAMITDPTLRESASAALHLGAARAWWQATADYSQTFAGSQDETVSARAVDIREAGVEVLRELGITVSRIPTDLTNKIVLATDLGPAEVPSLIAAGARAALLAESSTTAHAVIVARGLGLPMVIRAGETAIAEGQQLILDGDTGSVHLHPSLEQQTATSATITQRGEQSEILKQQAQQQVRLPDGKTIKVYANIGSVQDARAAVENGADGVGLLRTELLVLDRQQFPDEDAQFTDLREIFEVLGEREIVVRVLDAGGDKPVKALKLDAVTNGFLGVRGLRWLLANPEVLHTQLRAICRAAVGHRLHLMAPMVTNAAEVTQFRQAIQRALISLEEDNLRHQAPEAIGVMIEVPAAALAADEICAVADFLSIGSNDLTSYTMAADRTIAGVADLLDPGSTAITRLIDQVCRLAAKADTPVAVCGEMAAVPDHAETLIRLGVTELSMAPSRIPQIKHHLTEASTAPLATLET